MEGSELTMTGCKSLESVEKAQANRARDECTKSLMKRRWNCTSYTIECDVKVCLRDERGIALSLTHEAEDRCVGGQHDGNTVGRWKVGKKERFESGREALLK
jgi:hypothetical protein